MNILLILDCASGTWGVNCINKCGQCRNGTVCDAVNGECQFGCNPGWKGNPCNESKFKCLLLTHQFQSIGAYDSILPVQFNIVAI